MEATEPTYTELREELKKLLGINPGDEEPALFSVVLALIVEREYREHLQVMQIGGPQAGQHSHSPVRHSSQDISPSITLQQSSR